MVIRFSDRRHSSRGGIPLKVNVPEDIYNWLINTASRSGISISEVVEVVVREYVRSRHE